MGAFSDLKSATRGFTSNPVKAGRYVARIDECAFFDTDQNGEMWKNTLTILAVDQGDEHRVGEVVHTFFRMKPGKKVFQQNLKAFLAGVCGVPDDEVGEADAKLACADDSPMKGMVTVLTVVQKTHRTARDEKTGEPVQYVTYDWSERLSPDEILEAIGEDGVERFFPNGL